MIFFQVLIFDVQCVYNCYCCAILINVIFIPASCIFQVGIYPWDVCAGAVIVEEAGGVCVDTLGGSFDLGSRTWVDGWLTHAEQEPVLLPGSSFKTEFHRLSTLGERDDSRTSTFN